MKSINSQAGYVTSDTLQRGSSSQIASMIPASQDIRDQKGTPDEDEET